MPDTAAHAGDMPAEPPATPAPAEPAAVAASATAELSPAACAVRLAELFPPLFGPEGPPRPLKLRIQADIQQRAPGQFSKRALSVFLSRYTTANAYLRALLQSPHRFDLDGQPAGEISAEHRQAATEELARRRAIHEERRAAERDARRAAEAAARQAQQAEESVRRDRAALLRAFETSTLTKANFCALKGLPEAELDTLLAQARQERALHPSEPPPGPRRQWRDDRPARAPDRRGPPHPAGAPKPGR